MAAKAKISSGYLWRMALIAVVCLLFAGWSAYDGWVKYPQINRLVDRINSYKQKHSDWPQTWRDYARENDLPEVLDDVPKSKTHFDVYSQFIQLAITGPIGLLFGYFLLVSMRRWIASNENGLSSNRGENVPYGSIKKLNKQRWDNKGIAVVYYGDDGGRRFVIDDWKFERAAADQVLLDLESQLQPEQFVGDVSEAAKAEEISGEEPETIEPPPESTT